MTLPSGFQPLLAFAPVPVFFITDDPTCTLRYVILLGVLADVRNDWPAGLAASMRNSATTIATSCSQCCGSSAMNCPLRSATNGPTIGSSRFGGSPVTPDSRSLEPGLGGGLRRIEVERVGRVADGVIRLPPGVIAQPGDPGCPLGIGSSATRYTSRAPAGPPNRARGAVPGLYGRRRDAGCRGSVRTCYRKTAMDVCGRLMTESLYLPAFCGRRWTTADGE